MSVLAHHALITALPFAAPAILIVMGMAVLVVRQRLHERREHGDR